MDLANRLATSEPVALINNGAIKTFVNDKILFVLLVVVGLHVVSLAHKGRFAKAAVEGGIALFGLAWIGLAESKHGTTSALTFLGNFF